MSICFDDHPGNVPVSVRIHPSAPEALVSVWSFLGVPVSSDLSTANQVANSLAGWWFHPL